MTSTHRATHLALRHRGDQQAHHRRSTAGRVRLTVAALVVVVLAGTLGLATALGATAATVDPNAWYVLVSRKSDKVLDVPGANGDGSPLVQTTRTDAASQQFRLVPVGDGWYELHHRASGKVVDLWEWSTAEGASFRLFADLDGANQRFRLADQSGYVRLLNRHSGKALQVAGASTAQGAAIVQGTDTKSYHQQWALAKVGSGGSTPTPTPSASPSSPGTPSWPSATGQQHVSSTISVSGTFDGGLVRYYGLSSSGQDESQPPMFRLADGAVLTNVILGSGAGDGVHCAGTCTLQNVWWEDVEEDAATLKGSSPSQVMTVDGGGARHASDKVFQHNGPGTFVIRNFQAADIGKLYRSCGNCSTQYARTVVVQGVTVTAPAKTLVGINSNLGDRATLSGVTIVDDASRKVVICEEYRGVTSGEPTKIGAGPSAACGYSPSAVVYR